MLTQVFVGPNSQGIEVSTGYDESRYDQGTPYAVAEFDEGSGVVVYNNKYNTGRIIDNGARVMVSVNGQWLFDGNGFTVDSTNVIISGPVLQPLDVVSIMLMTDSLVPGKIGFRIFQNMNRAQFAYRITENTSTALAEDLSATGNVIYLKDASRLPEPNLEQGIFGLITIDGERIGYRSRNLNNNTVSGLVRGTAGTGAALHLADAPVYSISSDNLLPQEYQDYNAIAKRLADGNTTTFYTSFVISDASSEFIDRAIMVYVGGTLQTSGYTITTTPQVQVEFDTAPQIGYQIQIMYRRGKSWYEPGSSTPSNGIALQEQTTLAARFIQGKI